MTDFPQASGRAANRHTISSRAAAWFDIGPAAGQTCELLDISVSGFAIFCDDSHLSFFLDRGDQPLYCVLLFEGAHLGCMVWLANNSQQGVNRLGFCFETMPDDEIRLLKGLVAGMAARNAELKDVSA